MPEYPTGTVTFLFTDIEGSTRLLHELGDAYRAVQEDHFRLMRAAIAEGEGLELRTEGDAFFVVFRSAPQAVRAAVSAQRALAAHDWPHGRPVRVRMGMHTGEGLLGGDDYLGIDVNRAARIAAAGHGGQVLLSETTRALVQDSLPEGVSVRDLGEHRLKDLPRPERLHQLAIDGLPRDFPPLKTLDVPTNLPTQRTSFVGRNRELAQVIEAIEGSSLVTLTGPGGTGKTRLALEAAGRVRDRFPHGAFFVDLSPITDASLVSSAVAEALGVPEDATQPILETLVGHLRDRALLLVLDNFEQVTEAASAVERCLDVATRLRVLATSRVPLHLYGEREVPVPPLGLPDPAHLPPLDALTQFEAVALFIERATAVRPDFRVTNENAPAVAEITARLEGLPLAVELAASRVKVLSPEAMLARLGQRLPLLTGGARNLPERQRTLRGAIEWSHDLLDDHERTLFARLAVFAGGWALESAEAVCGPGLGADLFDVLSSLVDKSLVLQRESEGQDRFGMLETIREFAAERLRDSGELDELRLRHAEHFRELAEEAEPHLTGEHQKDWLDRFEREEDNVRAALAWAEESGNARTGLRTAASLWRSWQQRGRLSEPREWLERLLALPGERDAARAWALAALGGLAYWQNEYEPMERAYDESLAIAREIGEPSLLANALHNAGYLPMLRRDPDRATPLFREATEKAKEAGDRSLAAEVSVALGFSELLAGEADAALQPLLEGLVVQREEGNRWLVADTLTGLATAERMRGDLDAATRAAHESLRIFVEVGNPLGAAADFVCMASIAVERGDHERAARLLGAEARIRDDHGGGIPPEFMAVLQAGALEARKVLSEEDYQRAHAEGYAMDLDAAMAYALEEGS